MKSIKQLEKNIERIDKGCKTKKTYIVEGGGIKFYTCGKVKKCFSCELFLIQLSACLGNQKEMIKEIEKCINHTTIIGLDYHCKKIVCNYLMNELKGGK